MVSDVVALKFHSSHFIPLIVSNTLPHAALGRRRQRPRPGRLPKHVKDDVVHAELASILSVAVERGKHKIIRRDSVDSSTNRNPAVNCFGFGQYNLVSPLDEIAVCLRLKAVAESSRPPSVRLGDLWTPKEVAVDLRRLKFWLHACRSARRSCHSVCGEIVADSAKNSTDLGL